MKQERGRENIRITFWKIKSFRWIDLVFHEVQRLRGSEEDGLGMRQRWGGWLSRSSWCSSSCSSSILCTYNEEHHQGQPEAHYEEHHDEMVMMHLISTSCYMCMMCQGPQGASYHMCAWGGDAWAPPHPHLPHPQVPHPPFSHFLNSLVLITYWNWGCWCWCQHWCWCWLLCQTLLMIPSLLPFHCIALILDHP